MNIFKIIISLFILTIISCKSQASDLGVPIGVGLYSPNASVLQLNSTGIFGAWSFIADGSKTINTVSFYVSAISGALDSDDINVSIYNTDTATGKPSSSLASTTAVTATPTGASVVTVTGLSYSVTAGAQYYVVIKNDAAAPATNNFSVRRYTGIRNDQTTGGSLFGVNYATTSDSGTTWTVTSNALMCQVGYSDGSIQGLLATNNGFTGGVYGSSGSKRHEGVYLVTPEGATLKANGFYISISKTGTPTGILTAKMRIGTSIYTSTNTLAAGQVGGVVPFALPSTVEIPGGSVVRITFENNAADSSSNCYRMPYYMLDDSSANKAIVPLQTQYTLSVDDAATWANTDEYLVIGGLVLDLAPFSAISSPAGGAYAF